MRLAVGALAVVALLSVAPPARAEVVVEARAAALSSSASCSLGDIEITYKGGAVERQRTNFTTADGRELHRYDTRVYASNHEGLEYILSQTRTPPPPGSIVAVHVTIGTSPPDAKSGEFIVAYRCDAKANDAGGHNEVVYTCVGPFGTCLTTAKQVAEAAAVPTSGAASAVPAALVRFTG